MNFYNAYQLDGYLYAYQSEWGIARYREGDASWEKLPSARGRTDPTEFEFLSAMSVVNGKLYVGYEWNLGVFRWDDGKWTSVTPKDAQQRMETSHTVKVIAGYRGRLFQAGSEGSGIAMMTPRDSGKVVWGDWKLVDVNWCKIANGCPDQTRAILGIGDTLYATGWSFVAKVPFSDLDKMARPMFLN